ncbi:MAG: hypothetical protein OEW21_14855 [Betaproteobacteria bacterium]|nr:hypothetical protein [Betaproteobacteria bacterium]
MAFRIFSAIVAALLVIGFIWPVLIKLKEVALFVVAAIGIAMMLWESWETVREKDE